MICLWRQTVVRFNSSIHYIIYINIERRHQYIGGVYMGGVCTSSEYLMLMLVAGYFETSILGAASRQRKLTRLNDATWCRLFKYCFKMVCHSMLICVLTFRIIWYLFGYLYHMFKCVLGLDQPMRFPRALAKSAHIDQEAVETACAALAVNVLKGAAPNRHVSPLLGDRGSFCVSWWCWCWWYSHWWGIGSSF